MGNTCATCSKEEDEKYQIDTSINRRTPQTFGEIETKNREEAATRIQANFRAQKVRRNFQNGDMLLEVNKAYLVEGLDPVQEKETDEGAVYKGQFKGDLKEGFGVQTWPDQSRYIGLWKDDQMHGFGSFEFRNGDVYKGLFENGVMQGLGMLKTEEDQVYRGKWESDSQNGWGFETWQNGQHFSGEYKNGTKQGYGHYFWSEGNSYFGDWEENKIDGKGTYLWADGRVYHGAWKANSMHGKGIYKWTDGRFYCGDYELDKKEGQGVYKWADNRCYLGEWKEGKQHGNGHIVMPNGPVKKVTFEKGQRTSMEDETSEEKIEEVRKHLQLVEDEVKAVQASVPKSHLTTCSHQAKLWAEFEEEHRIKEKFTLRFEDNFSEEVVSAQNMEQNLEQNLPAIVEEVVSANE